MILIFTIIGIFVLFLLKYYIYNKENRGIKLKEFLISKKFCETLIELMIIVLGATIAINFTNIQEKQKDKQNAIDLLEEARFEIYESYKLNKVLIEQYDQKNIGIVQLKYNAKNNNATLRKILDNSMIIVTISSLSYRVLCNNVDNANSFYDFIARADKKDKAIYTYIRTMNSHLETIMFEIDNEILYLKGKRSEKNLKVMYNHYFNTKYKSVDSKQTRRP